MTSSDTLQQLLDERHSCRAFQPTPVPRQTIDTMLAMAQRTASWCNAQPWHVHIVSGAPLKAVSDAMLACAHQRVPVNPDFDWPREYRGVYQERRRECGWALYEAVGIAKGDRDASARQANENFRMFGAPHLAVLSSDEALGSFGAIDCGGWLSNFLLAATSLGIATIPQAAVGGWPDVLRQHLGIGADRKIVCGVSFGFEDAAHPANRFRTTRAAAQSAATWVD